MHQSLFMSALSAHPDRSLSVCWEQHCKLLPGVAGISASAVTKWTIDEVRCKAPPPPSSPTLPSHHALTGGLRKGPPQAEPNAAPDTTSCSPLCSMVPPSCPAGLTKSLSDGPILVDRERDMLLVQLEIQQERQASALDLKSKGLHLAHPTAQRQKDSLGLIRKSNPVVA